MLKYIILYVVNTVLCLNILDFSTFFVANLIYLLGMVVVCGSNKRKNISLNIIKLYHTIYWVGFIYILLCYSYMVSQNYEYLLAYDVYNYFMPKVYEFLSLGGVKEAWDYNWQNFNLFSRYQSGYFGYLIPFAFISKYFDSNIYISMQLSSLLIGSFSSIVIYKIFLLNNFKFFNAYKYTLLICIFSILFLYSTLLLRDIVVMFFYLLGIMYTFKKEFSFLDILKIILVILISCTLRVETGLFLFYLIPLYLYLTMQTSRKKDIVIFSSIIFISTLLLFLLIFYSQIFNVVTANNDIYLDSDKGDGVVGFLQNIPIIGSILSIFYNAIQPIPLWVKLDESFDLSRPEAYNIMAFPISIGGGFNWIVISFIVSFILIRKIRFKVLSQISNPLIFNLFFGFLFLYIQSSVISQRRLMAYYVLFYIFSILIAQNISLADRKKILFLAFLFYFLLNSLLTVFML
ncbi:hypothetical protein [Acinetobacter sp. YH12239]|uniref:hypothetical protein n=1 Tax=Acinetobacter sp. YH12239 TaxID=2601166 RepID=UPI0015D36E94|nr:hypothetical protein [Acinetobacter sp. YH12239]